MPQKYGSLASEFLTAIGEATGFFQWPLEHTGGWRRKQMSQERRKTYYQTLWRLKRGGLVKELKKEGKTFLVLTEKGELATLLLKARLDRPAKWDGKWRTLIFDIPEDAREKRDQLRGLLKKNGFIKLQASVFINPYPLNREAIEYLQQKMLMPYIRIMRVDEMDNDEDLKKKFNLK